MKRIDLDNQISQGLLVVGLRGGLFGKGVDFLKVNVYGASRRLKVYI